MILALDSSASCVLERGCCCCLLEVGGWWSTVRCTLGMVSAARIGASKFVMRVITKTVRLGGVGGIVTCGDEVVVDAGKTGADNGDGELQSHSLTLSCSFLDFRSSPKGVV